MTISLVKFILLGSFLFVCLPAGAQVFGELFKDQRVLYSSTVEETAYRLTLSSLKKINAEWLAEREEPISGKLERRTIELSRPYTPGSAWLEIQQFFSNQTSQLIFECQGLGCGSSNAWANERFEIKQLYGLDLSQRYQVWQVSWGGRRVFVTLYLVQRGNKRVYLQFEILTPQTENLELTPSAEVIANTFYRDGQIEVLGLSFDQGNIIIDETYLAVFAKAFNLQPFRPLVIVGHDFLPGSSEEQTQRSLSYAQAVYESLLKLGIQERRMQAKGLGSLAPDKKTVAGKVVVLLQHHR